MVKKKLSYTVALRIITVYYDYWTKKYFLNFCRHCILDEVDRMLDMGFQESVEEILGASYTTGVTL